MDDAEGGPEVNAPIHCAACPCCASSLVRLVIPWGSHGPLTLHGRQIGPIVWTCAFCGYSLMGLAVPVRAASWTQSAYPCTYTILDVLAITEVTP